MEIWQLAAYGGIGFVMSVLSGIAGAGGGFVMTPLLIFMGLSPAQAVATGKITGLTITIGSLSGLKKQHGAVSRKRILSVMLLALVAGLVSPFIIKSLDSSLYQIILGILLLLMIPVLIYKKIGIKPHRPKPSQRIAGGFLLSVALLLQGAFSGGLGTLVNVVLMGMLGMSAIEANITKRWSQVVLNTAIIIGVVGSGLIDWQLAIIGGICTLIGGYVGGRVAARKGNRFVMNVLIGLMLVSGVMLLTTA